MTALCEMTGLSRAGFYRWRTPRQATPVAMELRDQMQRIAVEWPAYGYIVGSRLSYNNAGSRLITKGCCG